MKTYAIGRNDEGQRLDRFLGKLLAHLPSSFVQKSLRLKKIRINGVRCIKGDTRLKQGDAVQVYLTDAQLTPPAAEDAFSHVLSPRLTIVYEDAHLLLLHKPAGMSVHPDEHGAQNTLITHALAYLYQSGFYRPDDEHTFVPALCHRLDRNTEGLVMVAKTHEALVILGEKIKNREIRKYYLCLVHGKLSPPKGVLRHALVRDTRQKQVFIAGQHASGQAKTAVTHYTTLHYENGRSLVECELVTGRTHQIRAQMAFGGHPLVGDGKYGRPEPGFRGQALCAYKLTFAFETPAGALDPLRGRTFVLGKRPAWAVFSAPPHATY